MIGGHWIWYHLLDQEPCEIQHRFGSDSKLWWASWIVIALMAAVVVASWVTIYVTVF